VISTIRHNCCYQQLELLISLIRITDINNSYWGYQQFELVISLIRISDINNSPQLMIVSLAISSSISLVYQLSVSYRRTVYLLLELLFVKFGYFSVSYLSQADISYAIDSICMS